MNHGMLMMRQNPIPGYRCDLPTNGGSLGLLPALRVSGVASDWVRTETYFSMAPDQTRRFARKSQPAWSVRTLRRWNITRDSGTLSVARRSSSHGCPSHPIWPRLGASFSLCGRSCLLCRPRRLARILRPVSMKSGIYRDSATGRRVGAR